MANIVKQNPVGIDVYIENIKNAIYSNFTNEWTLTDSDWNSYGRIQRLFDKDGKEYLPQPFDSGDEYNLPALFQDTVKLQTFFDILETQKIGTSCQSTLHVVFYCFCDLQAIFGLSSDRLDETMVQQVASFVQQQFNFNLHSKRIGIKTIMKDWNGYAKNITMVDDVQPKFAFALEFEINEYYICYSSPLVSSWQQPEVPLIPYTRYNPTGIDIWIQNCQVNLFNFVLGIFNGGNGLGTVGVNDYDCFGRVYRTYKEGKAVGGKQYIPQAFVKFASTGSFEYANVMFDDTKIIQSFFDVGEAMRESSESLLTYAEIKIYFFLNLNLLYPNAPTTERYDEQFIILISQFLMENSGFEMTAIQRGIKAIMNEYSGYAIKENSKFNMQPYLCFRCDMKKYYDESLNSCTINAGIVPGGGEFDPQEFDDSEFA